jgi:hypothetical protein
VPDALGGRALGAYRILVVGFNPTIERAQRVSQCARERHLASGRKSSEKQCRAVHP